MYSKQTVVLAALVGTLMMVVLTRAQPGENCPCVNSEECFKTPCRETNRTCTDGVLITPPCECCPVCIRNCREPVICLAIPCEQVCCKFGAYQTPCMCCPECLPDP